MNAKHNKIVLKKKPLVITIFLRLLHPDTKIARISRMPDHSFITGIFLLIFGVNL
jgi:hypothetical protein